MLLNRTLGQKEKTLQTPITTWNNKNMVKRHNLYSLWNKVQCIMRFHWLLTGPLRIDLYDDFLIKINSQLFVLKQDKKFFTDNHCKTIYEPVRSKYSSFGVLKVETFRPIFIVFTPVCHSVHGGRVSATPPPLGQTPSGRHPPCAVHTGIRSTSAWYASYWSVFFLHIKT